MTTNRPTQPFNQSVQALYPALEEINRRPEVFASYTAEDLWTDEHTSSRMLAYHLDGAIDVSSRKMEFIDRSAAWIIRHFGLKKGARVADFGCGPGLYTTRLASSGADVTGIDFSERSLQHAREQARIAGLEIDYVRANYLEYESDRRFDLITLIMCDYCALSPVQRVTMLDVFRRHLKPGGVLLFDVYSLAAFDLVEEKATRSPQLMDGFWSPEPYLGFLNTFKYKAEKVTLDKYTIVEAQRSRVIYNWLQYFTPVTLEAELKHGGLTLEATIGNVAGDPFDPSAHEFAVVARQIGLPPTDDHA